MFEPNELVVVLWNEEIYTATYIQRCESGSHMVRIPAKNLTTSVLEFNIWDINCFNIPGVFRNEAIKVLANFHG